MAHTTHTTGHALPGFALSGLGLAGTRLSASVSVWLERRRARKELGALDDHMLRDIGLTRYEAEQIASKPFWRA